MRNIDWILVQIRGWPPVGGGDLVLGHGGEAGHQSGLGPGQPQQRVEAAPVLHCGGAGGLRVAASSVHVVCQQLRQQPELEIERVCQAFVLLVEFLNFDIGILGKGLKGAILQVS